MAYSRLGRYEEKKQLKRLIWSIGGSILLLVLIGVFGLKLLEGFSVLLARLKGGSNQQQSTQSTLILPPILDATFEATNTATIKISGKSDTKSSIILYVNEKEMPPTSVDKDGVFIVDDVKLTDGQNSISAKAKDEKGTLSDLSNVLTISLKKSGPTLDVTSPTNNASYLGDTNTVSISGKTDDDATVTVNGRMVVVQNGGSFQYDLPLSTGTNDISIIAVDLAGNKTTVTRSVSYQK